MLSRIVIKTSTNQINTKLRRLSEEQKHNTEINFKRSSQHQTAMLCGRAFSKLPSINRNLHLQTMTPPSQINWITSTAYLTEHHQSFKPLCAPRLRFRFPTTSLHCPAMGGEKSLHKAKNQEGCWPRQYLIINTEVLCRTTCPNFLWNLQPLSQPMQSPYLLQVIHHHSCSPKTQSFIPEWL